MTARYRLRIAGPAAKALTDVLPEKVTAAAYEFITGPLLSSSHRVGKPLDPSDQHIPWNKSSRGSSPGSYGAGRSVRRRAGVHRPVQHLYQQPTCRYTSGIC
jgi:hypothetical protein